MPAAPSIFDAGAVRVTMPAGYREHTRFILNAPGTKLTVSRFDDRAPTPADVAAVRRRKVKDMTDGAAKFTREESIKVGERPAEVTVIRVKDSSGEVSERCSLIVELAPNRYADIVFEGAKTQALFDSVIPTIRVGGAAAPAPTGRASHDFIELTLALPATFARSSPFAFSNADAGIEWTADSAKVESPAYAALAKTMPDTLAGTPGLATRDYKAEGKVGEIQSADLTDIELGGLGDRVVRAAVFLSNNTIKLVLQGRAQRPGVEAMEKDLLAILAAATPAGGAR